MKIKRLLAIILLAAVLISCVSACSSSGEGASSSHIHTESEQSSGNTSGSSNGDNTTSDKGSAGVQRPDKQPDKEEENKVEKLPELSEQGQSTSKKLFEDIEKLNPEALHFFRVKNTNYASTSYVPFETLNKNLDTFNVIKDKTTIQHLKDALEYSTWTPKKYTAGGKPSIVIYFDDKLHLNIEGEVNGVYWMSLGADYGKVYYVVPKNVHENVLAFCYELEK